MQRIIDAIGLLFTWTMIFFIPLLGYLLPLMWVTDWIIGGDASSFGLRLFFSGVLSTSSLLIYFDACSNAPRLKPPFEVVVRAFFMLISVAIGITIAIIVAAIIVAHSPTH